MLLLALVVAGLARAAETQFWVSSTAADYSKAEVQGVVALPDGSLELGYEVTEAKSDSASVYWSAAVLADGSVALGSGHRGRVDRWVPGQGVEPWVSLGAGQVFCLARDGADLYAGTGPDGCIYKIGPRGDTTLVARTGERYVWGLARAAKGWYAATGTRGRLLAIEGGRTRVVWDSDETNLVSLVSDGRGGAYTGGDTQGRILHVRADGSARTVFDASENEIRALALGPDGALYAAALNSPAAPEEDHEDEPRPAKTGTGRSTLYRIVPDSVAVSYWTVPQPLVFALAARGGQQPHLLVAAGNRAALYRVDGRGSGSLIFAASGGQFTAVALDARGDAYVVGSNPGVVYRVSGAVASRGTLTPATLDARRYARFGRIRWRGEARGGRVSLFTRSGNIDPPDSTWGPWEGGEGESFRVRSAAARYLQWRIQLEKGSGAGPHVEAVEVAYREQNLPPRLEELSVAPQAGGFREGELTPRSEPVTQALPGGQRVEFSLRTGEPRALKSLPQWVRGLRVVQWKASDPNGDELTYRLAYRREPGGEWQWVPGDLSTTSYIWDTAALPDGRYRVRVSASDSSANAVEEAQESSLESAPFIVDNTPPEVTELAASAAGEGVEVRGRAHDSSSILTRLEIAVDADDWRPLAPTGGFADDEDLAFATTLRGLGPGEHTVSVRAVDAAGNSVTRAATVRVGRR
jgi:hypothetical protein